MSSLLLHSSAVQRFGLQINPGMHRDMVVFQSIAHNRFRNILTGAALLLLPCAAAVAQTSVDEPLPNPQSRPSVESYSLPPGTTPDGNVLQGPADAEIPLVRPSVVAPRTAPDKAPAESTTPAVEPGITDNGNRNGQGQQPVEQAPPRPQVTRDISPPTPEPPIEESTPASDQPPVSTDAPASIIAPDSPPSESLPESPPEPAAAKQASQWYLLLLAGLLFILLGALFFWRARRATAGQSTSTAADRVETSPTDDSAQRVKPLPAVFSPPPAIAIGFRPHAANATLFNAVLGFELTLSNHGGEALTGIRVSGSMDQAGEQTTGDPALPDDSAFGEIAALEPGETETIVAEFRIPLASIRPIAFRSQALFIPQVQFSIEYTDDSGFRHFQTVAYLVGQEHQPPRQKMAPFRLDMGPRSFTPLGHRLLAAG